ncbi:hypothetical protein FA15DRAFT_680768 [Coprinopsis marcescibilis]|uniref:Uncharacterized protein n=1 Tax=Coprinopsis marcescibilis TaxID=230819 RepID=A0A5C3KUP3_COPMA|nr:hypothetical protein FA15DRAFT_680768 [Coprinopsis marcescibilis]
MSLPQASKDVGVHPKRGSVVDPVDKRAQAADVERKLRLYGVIQAFRKGRLPSNAQIDRTLDYVLKHSPVTTQKLSPDGQKLVQDVKDIVGTAKLMVKEKNGDELFQNFVWHTQGASNESNVKISDMVAEAATGTVDSNKAKKDGEDAVRHLRTLLTLVLTNSEARKLLSDFSVIGRDLLAKGAVKAAQSISPDADRLAHVDESAPNDQFITEGGRIAGPNETPVLEGTIPFTGKKIRHHPKEDSAFVQDQDKFGQEGRKPVGDVVQENQQLYQGAKQRGAHVGKEALGEAAHHADEYREMDEQGDEEGKEQKKKGFMGKMREVRDNVRDGFSDRVPQDRKDQANGKFERGKKFLSEEYFPEERRDQFIFRGKKVILECQKHDDYQASMRWLLSYLEEYVNHAQSIQQTTGSRVRDQVPADKSHPVKLATLELRTLLERFANNTSMDMIFDAIDVVVDDTRRDEELRGWFKAVDAWMRRVLLEPGYIIEPDCDNQGRRLRESGRHFYEGKYKSHFDNLFNSIGNWAKAMGEDPLNKEFGDDWARLTKDLLFDNEGKLQFKPELWNDIRKVILPQLIQKVGYIPIPRIEYTDESLDLVIENLTLQGRNLFPNIVSFDIHNHVRFSPYDAIPDEGHHKITFTLQHIQADMRDVAFYYRKKTGIPKMKDSGLADVLISGEGVNAHVTLVSTTRDRSSIFHVQDVTVKVDNLKFSIRDSKHDFLYKTLRPLATGLVKKQIQKAIQDGLKTGLEYVDGQLVGVRDRMEHAKVTEGESRTEVLKELFNRSQAKAKEADAATDIKVQRGAVGGSIKTSSSTSSTSGKESQFKIVSDKRHSLLSNIGNPAGWVNRAADKDSVVEKKTDVAGQGTEGWKSDA